MHSLTACLFPDTFVSEACIAPLVHIFSRLVHLEPSTVSATALGLSDWRRELVRQQRLMPWPLALPTEQETRFQSLIQRVINLREEYPNQLKMLLLAKLGGQASMEQCSGIRHSLRNLNASSSEPLNGNPVWEQQWRDRLLLILAELHASQHRELAEGFMDIAAREEALLASLKGADEEEDDEDENMLWTQLSERPARMAPSFLMACFKAWTKLYLNHPSPPHPSCFVTCEAELVSLLQEAYEAKTESAMIALPPLSLPRLSALDLGVKALIEDCPSLSTALRDLIRAATAPEKNLTSPDIDNHLQHLLHRGAAAWEAIVEQTYPTARFGRLRLTFHLFPGQSFDQLAANAANICAAQVNKDASSGAALVALLA